MKYYCELEMYWKCSILQFLEHSLEVTVQILLARTRRQIFFKELVLVKLTPEFIYEIALKFYSEFFHEYALNF